MPRRPRIHLDGMPLQIAQGGRIGVVVLFGKEAWQSIDEFVQEVAEARIYDGVHYLNSTVVGTAMRLGELVAVKLPR